MAGKSAGGGGREIWVHMLFGALSLGNFDEGEMCDG